MHPPDLISFVMLLRSQHESVDFVALRYVLVNFFLLLDIDDLCFLVVRFAIHHQNLIKSQSLRILYLDWLRCFRLRCFNWLLKHLWLGFFDLH